MQSQTRTREARPNEIRSQDPAFSAHRDDAAWIPLAFALQCSKARKLSLTPEVAGFLLLSAFENSSQLPPIRYWYINTLGQIAWATGRGNEILSGRQVLIELLAASNGSHAGLWRCAQSNAPVADRHGFTHELRNALVPLNRAASLRGLIRLAKAASELFADADYCDESPVNQASETDLAHTPKEAPFARTGVVAETAVASIAEADADKTPFSIAPIDFDSPDFEVVSHLPPLVVETYQPAQLTKRATVVESPDPPAQAAIRTPEAKVVEPKPAPSAVDSAPAEKKWQAPTPAHPTNRTSTAAAPRGQVWFSLVLLIAAAIAIFGHRFADLRDVFFGPESRAGGNSRARTAPPAAPAAKTSANVH
jgi:hypothetical protein